MKIGPVDTEIALLIVKKRKKKKLTQAKYIGLPSGLKNRHTRQTDIQIIQYNKM